MSLARTTLQPLHVAARSSLHSHALARRTAGAVPRLSLRAFRTAVTRRTVSTTSRSSSSSASSAARWTAIAALGGSLALGLSVMQTRSVYMEEAQGDKASLVKKKGKKESKKDEGGESDAPQKQAKKDKSEQSAKTPREEKADEAKTGAAGSDEPRSVKEDDVQEASSLDMDDLSEEASQQSAFDPETNTINWDCPCLGGMAHGPCGEQFKEAFSCFVFSEADPKGVDCIDHFKAMQDCFRKYPEHYKEELEDEEEASAGEDAQPVGKVGGSESEQVSSDDQEEDEGLREWRAEMAKEQ